DATITRKPFTRRYLELRKDWLGKLKINKSCLVARRKMRAGVYSMELMFCLPKTAILSNSKARFIVLGAPADMVPAAKSYLTGDHDTAGANGI
ncbi:MAG: hypothetical protein WDN48_15195, partial [Pseudolabrys sp.]